MTELDQGINVNMVMLPSHGRTSYYNTMKPWVDVVIDTISCSFFR